MTLAAGTRLGSYEILSPLGAGGMGEVYRATDTRLKRQVAIKIMPADLAADPSRLARFQREAEVLASLNHPLIGAIYGLETSDGVQALVMELVEGLTLADRIEQGPIPVDEAVAIARQIAEALEAAHEQGIVHRDLKPANIKLRDDGTVKVLDFGLAKAQDRGASSSDLTRTIDAPAPAIVTSPVVTNAGLILGTAAYMSPEQARGKAVDKRTDVWAFGAVLYEMLTGARAFDGEDVTEVMAAVVKSEPDWSKLPANTPRHIVTLIRQCLDKDRKTRIGDIAVARFVLSGVEPSAAARGVERPRSWAVWAAAAAAALVALPIGFWLGGDTREVSPLSHLELGVQPAEYLTPSGNSGPRPVRVSFAWSPDGRRVVFSGAKAPDKTDVVLYARDLDRGEAERIKGTENGYSPFFSPDGNWIGFWAGNTLKKIPAAGGPATTICDLPPGSFWGASWGDADTIYFAARTGIFKVPAAGGTPEIVTSVDASTGNRHLSPQPLPGGALIYTAPPDVMYRAAGSTEDRVLIEDASDARFVAPGHLLYMQRATLTGVAFDAGSGRLSGAPVALIENVMQGVNAGNGGDETLIGQFAVSQSGHLLYATGGIMPSRTGALMWVDRSGAAEPVKSVPEGRYLFPKISPDGERVAMEVRAPGSRSGDVWVYDLARGSGTRLTFEGGGSPVWSPDGTHLAITANGLKLLRADGTGKPEALAPAPVAQTPSSWSRATNVLAFLQRPSANTSGIWSLPMSEGSARKSALFLETPYGARYVELSPDGKWLAYVSNESGGPGVYVQAFPSGGEKTQVSIDGGYEPLWHPNSREIFFRGDDLKFKAVAIRSVAPLRVDAPRVMFEAKPGDYDATTPIRSWDISPDGRRFLLVRPVPLTDPPVSRINVVLNWIEELQRRVPR
jgi:eukaryotic-like serine/threonine-protein kinase